jgi:hypothetical protein
MIEARDGPRLVRDGGALHQGSNRSTANGTEAVSAEICSVSPRSSTVTLEYEFSTGCS